jgi:hypothetical protein
MSTRAISAFLKQEHKLNISAATIAKALRQPQKHIASLAESIEPDARIVADALELDLGELLAREDLFAATAEKPPVLAGESEQDIHEAHDTYLDARFHLEQSWYPLDESVRAMVIADISGREEDGE